MVRRNDFISMGCLRKKKVIKIIKANPHTFIPLPINPGSAPVAIGFLRNTGMDLPRLTIGPHLCPGPP